MVLSITTNCCKCLHRVPKKNCADAFKGLYSEAQANRDHRNLNKRRDYQALLEYLPQARGVLVEDDTKRQAYDEYAAEARTGAAAQPFEAFLARLSGEVPEAERTDVLGVQSGGARTQPKTGRPTPAAIEDRPVRRPQVQSTTQQGLMGSAISVIVFAILLAVSFFVTHRLPVSVLIAAIGGVIAWVRAASARWWPHFALRICSRQKRPRI